MKKNSLFILVLSTLLLVGCNGQSEHVHEWDSFFDNGDGTHTAVCHTDYRHTITDTHHYGDPTIIKEPTKTDTGIKKYVCEDCGSVKLETIPSQGKNDFVNEVVDEKYLYTTDGIYGNTYYKSSDDGSYGDDNALFECSKIPEGYSEVKYIKGDGVHTVDTGIKSDTSMVVSTNVYTSSTGKTSRLPSGYQEVEYVQSTGLEYIDLQLLVNYTDNVTQTTDIQYLTYDHQQWMGADCYGQISALYFSTTERINVETIYTNNGTFAAYLNGSSIISADFSQYKKTNVKYGLFRLGDKDNTWYRPETLEINTIAKIYSEQITVNDILVRDLVPCININTSKAGVFDLVSKSFFGNEGDGQLIPGEPTSPSSTSRLPLGYQEIEYLQSTGTQYIDTGVQTQNGLKYEIIFNRQSYSGMLAGAYTEVGERHYIGNHDSNNKLRYGYFDWYSSSSVLSLNTKYNLTVDFTSSTNQYMYLDGQIVASSSNASIYSGRRNSYLFAFNEDGLSEPGASAKIYSAKIYLNNVLTRDFVPAIQINTGHVGLYDIVDNKFYGNSGTGDFIAGDPTYNPITPASRLPKGYLEVEYIDQINAGPDEKYDQNCIELSNITYTKIEANMSVIGKGSHGGIILSGTSADWFLRWDDNPMKVDFLTTGKSGYVYPSTMSENSWNKMVVTFSDSVTGLRTAGWVDAVNYWCPQSVKISYLKVYDDDFLVGDFVPCVREKDSEAGLYDLVSEEFYSNVGPGQFDAGNYVNHSSVTTRLPYEYQEIEYVESTGKQCINTGIVPDGTLATEIVIQENMDAVSENAIFGCDWKSNGYFLMAYNNNLRFHSLGYRVDTIGMSDGQMKINTFSKALTDYILLVDDVPALISEDTGFAPEIELPIKIFDVSDEIGNPGSFKLYSFKISKGGLLARDFVPCVEKLTGEVGLYDLVSKEFFPNIGEEDLIAGPYVNISDHASGVGNIEIFKDNIYNSGSVYSSKFFNLVLSDDSGKISHEFVSVIRNSDCVAGFIDLNTNTFVPLPDGNFEIGPVVGHVMGDETIVKEATYNEDGEVIKTCETCGFVDHIKVDRLSWEVNFEIDSGVDHIEIYKSPYEVESLSSLKTYSRSIFSYVYTKQTAGVFIKIVFKNGYTLDSITGKSDISQSIINDVLIIGGIDRDQTIIIKTKLL